MRVLKGLLAFIVISAMGIFLLVRAIRDKAELAEPPLDIATMTEEDLRSGRYVEGDVTELWEEYTKRTGTDAAYGAKNHRRVTAYYFAMPLKSSSNSDAPKFVTLSVRENEDLITARKMAKESERVFEGHRVLVTKMRIRGKITKLRLSAASAFDDYLEKCGFEPKSAAVHYMINVGNDGSGSTYTLVIAIIITAVGVIGGIVALIRGKFSR